MRDKRILLIVCGGIAAYKACELIRVLRRRGASVRCVLTAGGAQFVAPMTLAALSEQPVHTSLWDLKDEAEMGHIRLSRDADLVMIAPATADMLAKMAAGIADDLATTLLLATDKPVLAAPAMNVRMWQHSATRRNVAALRNDGVTIVEPAEGEMACGEFGPGRLPEVDALADEAEHVLTAGHRLSGRHILVTAGPTHEPIDPVRYISNRSSGLQGFAVATAAARQGACVTLVSGPVDLPTPPGVTRIDVLTAEEMHRAVFASLPADAAILVAAVADWHVDASPHKVKKDDGQRPVLTLQLNKDILSDVAASLQRPALLIGFAAETENAIEHARAKRSRKGCDWIVANDVSGDVFGGDRNHVHLITSAGAEDWGEHPKPDIARRLIERIADALV